MILGDYKVDRDADLERPTRISLVNTDAGTLQLVDLGVELFLQVPGPRSGR